MFRESPTSEQEGDLDFTPTLIGPTITVRPALEADFEALYVPFMLETRLRALGGHFEGAANWQPFAIRDGQLVTGQNPQSSHLVAQQLLAALAER